MFGLKSERFTRLMEYIPHKEKHKEKHKRFMDYIPYFGFIGEDTLPGVTLPGVTLPGVTITKDGSFLRTFRYTVKNLAYADENDTLEVLRNLSDSLRLFTNKGWSLYVDSFRRRDPLAEIPFLDSAPEAAKKFDDYHRESFGEFFATENYITLSFNLYSQGEIDKLLGEDENLKDELYNFVDFTEEFSGMLSNSFAKIKALDNNETMTFYRQCVSPYRHFVRMPNFPFYLDYHLSDSDFYSDTITRLDKTFVHTLSICDFPAKTTPDMVTALVTSGLDFHYSVRFLFLTKDEAIKTIKKIRRSHLQKRKGILSIFNKALLEEETALGDAEAIEHIKDSSEALSALAMSSLLFGYVTITIVVMDEDWSVGKNTVAKLKRIIDYHGYRAKVETLNNRSAYLGTLHGNVKSNPRKPLISTGNLCYFFPISELWRGDFSNEHLGGLTGVNTPHMVTKRMVSPFYLNLNVGDTGRALIVGPTGAGKSILLAALAMQFFRYPGARVIFFDKDKSSENVCKNVGGRFLDIGSEDCEYLLNPFCDVSSESHRFWLSEFFGEYFRSKGLEITPREEKEMIETFKCMAQSEGVEDLSFLSFQQMVQDESIRIALSVFTDDGLFSRFFGPVRDDISEAPWVTFELSNLMMMDESVVKFALGYLLRKVSTAFTGEPVLLIINDAWLFLDNEYSASMIRDWLKPLRRKNVYVVLATQEMADVNKAISSTIASTCITKIFLPNNQARQSENRRLYHNLGLTDDDLKVLVNAKPQGEYFYASPKGKQLFELKLDERRLELLTKKTYR